MDAERLFTETKQGFDFYHRHFGIPYPFGKYDQLFVPEFNAGAMENAGAVTFLEDYVFRSRVTRSIYERRAETVLHEMAHMWFGDLVTMRVVGRPVAQRVVRHLRERALPGARPPSTPRRGRPSRTSRSRWAYRQDQLPSTHPMAADIPDLQAVEVNFDGITYAKGASVLKQLVAYVGLEPFLAGLRAYFEAHKWGNATFDDLLGALEQASGRDLSGWGARGSKTTGLNLLRPSFELADDGTFVRFEVVQGGARPGAGELRTHRIAVGVYDDDGSGKIVRTHRVEVDVEGSAGRPGAARRLPRQAGAGQRRRPHLLRAAPGPGLARHADRPDRRHRQAAASHTVLELAWEMTREAELKARDFSALVAGGFGAETEIGYVVAAPCCRPQTAIMSYGDEQWAAERGWPMLVDSLRFRLDTAPAGSDAQLAVVDKPTGGSVLPEVGARAVSAARPLGVDVPDGLTVDTADSARGCCTRWSPTVLSTVLGQPAATPRR